MRWNESAWILTMLRSLSPLVWLLICGATVGVDHPLLSTKMQTNVDAMGVNFTYLANEHICPTVDIRRASHFSKLTNCTVIEGDLHIVITSVPNEVKYRFPRLKEITGCVIIYYFHGFTSLGHLLPNLAVIRGQSLAYNYALAVKDTDMRALDLPSLRVILRGGVRMDSNPGMCHIHSIDWKTIIREKDASVRVLRTREICPDPCPSGCPRGAALDEEVRELCWSAQHCQSMCSHQCLMHGLVCHMAQPTTCCHRECLAGCYGSGPDQCVTCRHVLHQDRCVASCPVGFYKYLDRRCISRAECFSKRVKSPVDYQVMEQYAIHAGKCVSLCPAGYARNASSGFCTPCYEDCPKKRCKEIMVYSIKDLNQVRDCYSIKELYISIREGGETLMTELENAFAKLTEIEVCVKVMRSLALVSLGFLRNLRVIKGLKSGATKSSTIEETAALEVMGNEYMRELWDHRKRTPLVILKGTVKFNLNRHLCASKILDFIDNGIKLPKNLTKQDRDLITKSNGDLVECNVTRLDVRVSAVGPVFARVVWGPYDWSSRDLLAMLIMIKKTHQNVSLYEDRASCLSNSWKTMEITTCKGKGKCSHTLSGLHPATRYALYVEAKTALTSRGGISDVVYFTTRPTNPGSPQEVQISSLSSSELKVTWKPPSEPNGVISKYFVWYRSLRLDPSEFLLRDFCFQKSQWETKAFRTDRAKGNKFNSLTGMFPTASANETCSCELCSKVCKRRTIEGMDRDFSFEDHLHNELFSQNSKRRWAKIWLDKELEERKRLCRQHSLTISFYFKNCLKLNKKPRPKVKQTNSTKVVDKNRETEPDDLGKANDEMFTSLWMNDVEGNPLPIALDTPINGNSSSTGRLNRSTTQDWVHRIEVSAGKPEIVITNLDHFTEYVVEIQACQDPDEEDILTNKNNSSEQTGNYVNVGVGKTFSLYERKYCSKRTTVSQRTGSKSFVDNIKEADIKIIHEDTKSVRLLWPSPPQANGLVLYYLLRYRRSRQPEESWSPKCIAKQVWMSLARQPSGKKTSNDRNVSTSDVSNSPSPANALSQLAQIAESRTELGGVRLADLAPGQYEFEIMTVSLAGNGSWTTPLTFYIQEHRGKNNLLWLIGVFAALIVLTALVLIVGVLQHRRHKYLLSNTWVSPNPEYWNIFEIDEWELERSDVDVIQWAHCLGKGSFGMVYRGRLRRLTSPAKKFYPDPTNIEVAIKTISKSSSIYDRRDFINEACHMKQFQSFHLVRLLGVVSKLSERSAASKGVLRAVHSQIAATLQLQSSQIPANSTTNDPQTNLDGMPLVVMELMANGDLASYLRHMGDHGEGMVSEEQALLWAAQIADGMAYLEHKKYVHRDLAARNCMVDGNLVVKIGDFGLTRDIYDHNYYRKQGRGKMPIRWMAPESLKTAYFSSKSDVWAYGVVLWEIVTLASLPYRGMSHEMVMKYVVEGNTLVSNGYPTKFPDLLASLMVACWKYKEKRRPTFLEILSRLETFADPLFRENSFYHHPETWDEEAWPSGPGQLEVVPGTGTTDVFMDTASGRGSEPNQNEGGCEMEVFVGGGDSRESSPLTGFSSTPQTTPASTQHSFAAQPEEEDDDERPMLHESSAAPRIEQSPILSRIRC